MFAGLAILLLLGFHMAYTHIGTLLYGVEDNISFDMSQARDANPIFPVFFILMLGIALYHGLYGLRTILFELCPHPGAQKTMTAFLLVLGLALFGLGSFAAVKAHKNASIMRVDLQAAQTRAIR
jgi:succinate dehydrogenase / fumarate reductase membrane anchor subunit